MNIGSLTKDPAEVLDLTVDMSAGISAGDSISGNSVVAWNTQTQADDSATIIATSPAPFVVQGTSKIQFRVQAGSTGGVYDLRVTAQCASGQVLEGDVTLNITQG